MCFGWYQELLEQARAADLATAETLLLSMLNRGGMIVHVYRDTDPDNPELVGRHGCLRSFYSGFTGEREDGVMPHEVERFLLDAESCDLWVRAKEAGGALDERWAVVDSGPAQDTHRTPSMAKQHWLRTRRRGL